MPRILWAASLALTLLASPGQAQSIADVIKSGGLVTRWAVKCDAPASTTNFHVTFDVSNPDRVVHVHDFGNRIRRTYLIHFAKKREDNLWEFRFEDLGDKAMSEQMIRITRDTFRVMSNREDGGKFYIRDGMQTLSPGTPSVTLRHCG